jgi:benzoylformate decarboxylase
MPKFLRRKTIVRGDAAFPKIDRPKGLGNRRMGWGSDVAAEAIRRLDLKYIALVPGASYRGLHDSIVNYLGNANPQMLVCLHEEHAVAIADGYARVTEKPMAVALHSNVGLMHGIMPIFNSWCGRTPVIVFGATGPVDADKRRPWIDWIHTAKDQGALIRPFVKFDDQPASPQATVEAILRAAQLATTKPFGPVYVCLDADLQEAPLAGDVSFPDPARFRAAPPPPAPEETVKETLNLVRRARFPLFMMGRVTRREDDWARRVRLAEALGAVVITDQHNAAAFPTEHPNHVAAPSFRAGKPVAELLNNADVIVSFDWLDLAGTLRHVFGHAQTQEPVGSRIVSCSLDSYVHNGWSADHQALPAVDVPVLADPDTFIAQLLDALGPAAKKTASLPAAARKATHWTKRPGGKLKPSASGPLGPLDLALTVAAFARANKGTLSRTALGWAGEACRFDHPLDFLGNDQGGAVGTGPGHSVGAALALRDSDRMALSVIGDGDYLMGVNALWTASHVELPMMIVVANNRSYFNDEGHQERVALDRGRPKDNKWIGQQIDKPAVDLGKMAEAQGFKSEQVGTTKELVAALARGKKVVKGGGRTLIDARVLPGYAEAAARGASGGRGSK